MHWSSAAAACWATSTCSGSALTQNPCPHPAYVLTSPLCPSGWASNDLPDAGDLLLGHLRVLLPDGVADRQRGPLDVTRDVQHAGVAGEAGVVQRLAVHLEALAREQEDVFAAPAEAGGADRQGGALGLA